MMDGTSLVAGHHTATAEASATFGVCAVEEAPEELQAFRAHVAIVRGEMPSQAPGDALDMRRSLWVGPLAKAVVPLTAAAGAIEGSEGARGMILPAVVGLAGVLAIVASRRQDDTVEQGRRRFEGYSADVLADMSYELYRIGEGEDGRGQVAMRWYGPFHGLAGGDTHRFRQVTDMAGAAGVDQLVVGDSLAGNFIPDGLPGKRMSFAEWLKLNKHFHISGYPEQDMVHGATPEEWAEALKSNESLAVKDPVSEPEPMSLASRLPLQYEVAAGGVVSGRERTSLVRQTVRRVGMVAALATAGFAVATVVTQYLDQRYEQTYQQARADIARQHGSDAGDIDSLATRNRIEHYGGMAGQANQVWGEWRDLRNAVPDGINAVLNNPQQTSRVSG